MDNKIFTIYNLQVGPITVKSAFGHGGAQNEKTPGGGLPKVRMATRTGHLENETILFREFSLEPSNACHS